jgi:ribulose-5-phosphate 4-epimerase/fuculose-1-phosphate aldolase
MQPSRPVKAIASPWSGRAAAGVVFPAVDKTDPRRYFRRNERMRKHVMAGTQTEPATHKKPTGFEPEEWERRVQLAACYRIFAYLGWVELIFNHITVRLPGPERHFLINPFGLLYSEVTASNLVRIDFEGKVIGTSNWPVNPAGFTIHAAIHRGIPDAHCVMHTHTTAGMAVACSQRGLSMSNFNAMMLYGKVAYHDFEGITVRPDEGPRLLRSIGDKPAVILRNHGLLAWGETVPACFRTLHHLNRACEIQVASTAMGPVIEIPEEICIRSAQDSMQMMSRNGVGADVFAALVRSIDRIDPSYRS